MIVNCEFISRLRFLQRNKRATCIRCRCVAYSTIVGKSWPHSQAFSYVWQPHKVPKDAGSLGTRVGKSCKRTVSKSTSVSLLSSFSLPRPSLAGLEPRLPGTGDGGRRVGGSPGSARVEESCVDGESEGASNRGREGMRDREVSQGKRDRVRS